MSASPQSQSVPAEQWQQGCCLTLMIDDLSDRGDGVGHWQGRAVFVPDTAPGDRVRVRLLRVKPSYAHARLDAVLDSSRYRRRPRCIVADKCGSCQWQHLDDDYQRQAKHQLVVQALERLGGFVSPPVAPVLTAGDSLGYRNKATYPLVRAATGQVQAGYYQRGTHRPINLNQCPIQDERLNPLLAEVKQDIQTRGWSIYNEEAQRGKLRHLALRIGARTGEQFLTLVTADAGLPGLAEQAEIWLARYPHLVGIALNLNPKPGNAIFGAQTDCIAGRAYLQEGFAGLTLRLRPDTFFQINTAAAEALLGAIAAQLALQGTETLVDVYCGIGTFTLPLAQQVRQAIGIEVQAEALELAGINANINGIDNITWQVGRAEDCLAQLSVPPDVILLDPPRQGCDRAVIEQLRQLHPAQLVYISCKPATLARDLQRLCQDDCYRLTHVQPADFFPQTAHVECAAFLTRSELVNL
ncbi:MAG: 23S rRNA (uracil(1939)-C(5))-methyltransferase RlmD [Spirulinaceae cyanobacterium RM2_2_10]|nr:23S rRNA (uracil(1939)-C(5))-methyltransferase RlmD [Spirulinaceae cyanobacterium RM2_2_10]